MCPSPEPIPFRPHGVSARGVGSRMAAAPTSSPPLNIHASIWPLVIIHGGLIANEGAVARAGSSRCVEGRTEGEDRVTWPYISHVRRIVK